MKNKISIIIPTHNRPKFLLRALNSINCQRKSVDIEIIVISDQINLETDKVCSENLSDRDIYMRRNGVKGPALSRNLGLNICTGDFVIFLDDDDELSEGFVSEIASMNGIGFSYGNFNIKDEIRSMNGSEIISEYEVDSSNMLNKMIYVKNQLPLSSFIFPMNLLRSIRYDLNMLAYEDWDFVLSVLELEKPTHINFKVVNIYQVSQGESDRRGSSAEANGWNAILDYIYVYKKHKINDESVKKMREELLRLVGLNVPAEFI